jgi:hypothetical protein
MSEHVSAELALILVALDPDDPERVAALAHAAACPACSQVLRDGEAMLKLLDEQSANAEIDPRLRDRILDAVTQEPQHSAHWEHVGLMLVAVLSAWLAWFDGHARTGLYPARGFYCMLWEVLGAALFLISGQLWAVRNGVRLESAQVALVAMAGGLLGQSFLRWNCPTHDAGLHLLAYHVTGVMLTACIGLVASQFARRRT